jgi:hypothetical protein
MTLYNYKKNIKLHSLFVKKEICLVVLKLYWI